MKKSPTLAELLVELHQLGARERRLIIDRLDENDRDRVSRMVGLAKTKPAPSFDALASLSPWLSESLAAARSKGNRSRGTSFTNATRDALLDAERLLPTSRLAHDGASHLSLLGRLFAKSDGA